MNGASRWIVAYLILVAALLLGAYRLETTARQTHDALCSLKSDLENRAQANRDILSSTDDEVIDLFGIQVPRSVIENNLRGQDATLAALSSLECG